MLARMNKQSFSDRFVAAFKESGMTAAALSRQAGVSYDVINKLKTRPGTSTSAENAAKISRVLEMDSDETIPDQSQVEALIDRIKGFDDAELQDVDKYLDLVLSRRDDPPNEQEK